MKLTRKQLLNMLPSEQLAELYSPYNKEGDIPLCCNEKYCNASQTHTACCFDACKKAVTSWLDEEFEIY